MAEKFEWRLDAFQNVVKTEGEAEVRRVEQYVDTAADMLESEDMQATLGHINYYTSNLEFAPGSGQADFLLCDDALASLDEVGIQCNAILRELTKAREYLNSIKNRAQKQMELEKKAEADEQ